jgi:hypothetical protein
MTEVTPALAEELGSRSSMQVHGGRIRKHELHQTHRVAGAGALPDSQLTQAELIENLGGHDFTHYTVAGTNHLHVIILQVADISLQQRQNFAYQNPPWDIPVGPEFQVTQLLQHYRSSGIECLSHNDSHAKAGHATSTGRVESEQLKGRNVDHNESSSPYLRKPAQSLQRQLDLTSPLLKRNVDLGESGRIEDPIHPKSVPVLKAAYRIGVDLTVLVAGTPRGVSEEITCGGEPAAQLIYVRILCAWVHRRSARQRPERGVGSQGAIAGEQTLKLSILRQVWCGSGDQPCDGVSGQGLFQDYGPIGVELFPVESPRV